MEHPIRTSLLKGWHGADGVSKKHWPVDDYKKETQRIWNWFVDGVIKYHRTVETYINTMIDSGFCVKRLLEPGPTAKALSPRPDLAEHLRRPAILVVAGMKN